MKIGVLSAISTVFWYFAVPDSMSRIQTLLFFITVYMASAYVIAIIEDQVQRIRKKRQSLKIRKPQRKIVDFKMRREIYIPAYKVMKDA